jgi:diaminohydroxyphosphoribosylaminopyrimidine deaminase / 5-amino-6-(5-phosphoribosylamino)uracil reductase
LVQNDLAYMDRALALAGRGKGITSPNPMVGAVVVKDGIVVGESFHRYAERKHAEVWAIEQAGERARGATLYVNLEPCSHFGRTGPCCDLVIKAGITRVVAAIKDPNPQVAGSGFERLKQAGVSLTIGPRETEARKLNEAYLKHILTRLPFVTLKAGMTLDGKIAARDGRSRWITSEASRHRAQQFRFENDALLVGIGTVLQDDPLLTDRSGQTRRCPLIRVILDANLRLPLESRLVRSLPDGAIIVFCSETRQTIRQRQLEEAGVEVVPVSAPGHHVPIATVLQELGRRDVTGLLIEGGAEVNFSALSSLAVDKIIFFLAPRILGGRDAVPAVGGAGFPDLDHSSSLRIAAVERIGPDLMVEAYASREKLL